MAVTKLADRQVVETIDLTSEVANTLPVGNGGTGVATITGLIKGSGTSAFAAATAGTDYLTPGATQTLTATRVNPRSTTINAPGATPTVASDSYDIIAYTGLAAAITSMTSGLTGTPVLGQKLMVGFKDNGTARAITWGASFKSSGVATLLATTAAGKQHWVGLQYDGTAWACLAVDATGY
jgi:hypothetical protein